MCTIHYVYKGDALKEGWAFTDEGQEALKKEH